MEPSKLSPDFVLDNLVRVREQIALAESGLADDRSRRAVYALWLVRNTDLTQSVIAGIAGISRVTLDKYMADADMTPEYLKTVREIQREKGIELYHVDPEKYLAAPGE